MMKPFIEVFKTNVQNRPVAAKLVRDLKVLLQAEISFDLDDCDHILRVEARQTIDVALIRNCMLHHGYEAEQLQ